MAWTIEVKTVLVNSIIAFIVGFVSFLINSPVINFFLAVALFGLTNYILRESLNIDKERNWWIGNGVVVFFMFWFIFWTLFYNLQFYGVL